VPDHAEGGLAALVLEYRQSLLLFLSARRVAPDEAQDLVHDLYLKLADRSTGPIGDAHAYLYQALDHMIVDRRRSELSRATRERDWLSTGPGVSGVDEAASPERVVSAQSEVEAVRDALSALPERTLFILRRYRLDGVGQRDIAADLGISVSAVEKHLQRAYRALVVIRTRLDAGSASPRRLEE
jgi:RNA polymerase sigma factor (sigma-70 family)